MVPMITPEIDVDGKATSGTNGSEHTLGNEQIVGNE